MTDGRGLRDLVRSPTKLVQVLLMPAPGKRYPSKMWLEGEPVSHERESPVSDACGRVPRSALQIRFDYRQDLGLEGYGLRLECCGFA